MRKMKNCSPTSRAKTTQTHFKLFGPIFVNAGWYIDRTWTFLGTEISFFHVSYGHIAALSEDYIIHQSSDPSTLFDTSSGIETDSQWFLTYQCFEHPSYCSFCHSATLSHPCQTHQWLPAVAPTLFPIIIVPTHTFCFFVMLCFPYLDNTDSHAVELHTRSDAIRPQLCRSLTRLTMYYNLSSMETRTVKLLKILPNMLWQVKPTLVVEPKLREGGKDLGDSHLL